MAVFNIGDEVEVYSDYHGYSYVTSANYGVLTAQDTNSFTVKYTHGGRDVTEHFTDLDNYHLIPRDTRVARRFCVECGIEMTGRPLNEACQYCGGF